MNSYTCDDNYNCDINYLPEDNVLSHIDIYDVLDTFNDISLAFLGVIAVTQLGAMCYNLFKMCSCKRRSKSPVKSNKLVVPDNKYVKIIRGVPGVGKRSYVYYLESDMQREYVICDINEFFIKNGNFEFDGKCLAEAEAYMMSKFVTAIRNSDRRIYVIGTFEKPWMYSNYINIAKLCGYSTYVTELTCENTSELQHFNKRSVHKIPYSKSLKAYNSWVIDPSAYIRQPYLFDNSELHLDRMPCTIHSESESESESNSESDSESDVGAYRDIPNVSNLKDFPQSREIKYLPASQFTDFKKLKMAFNTLKSNIDQKLDAISEITDGEESDDVGDNE